MVEEIAEIDAYANQVIEHTGDERTATALATARDNARGSLLLDDISADYNDISEALSCAIEACLGDPDRHELLTAGVAILRSRRAERESIILRDYRLVGHS